ncbi:sulfotransferase family protein [Gemmobacter lanyuensis]|uniref:Sulfotransferase family protein n=1 Tax=Gemmobacter lanyuensis TaxID=1054497 RepID=A0A918J4I2_9RHOB|nr:hypothetical protein [Gemmobacter lanyuensis]GGW44874.1 sulfotransferase family protein [Gemmobacter lanyuensis]
MAQSKHAENEPGSEAQGASPKAERHAVIVLPMHRSGSSALSRMLSLLGCDLPKTLMVGNETNPTGHWESTVVRALNDDILSSGGSKWQDWLAFNSNWYKTPKPREFQARALEVLAKEFGSSSLFVFKDPRVCRIFPFWRDVFAAAGIEPKIVLTVRHPQEVAASLERRKDNGIPALVGLLLWLRYMLDAEADTRGMTRAVASYDMLLQDPVGLAETLQARLGLFWPSLSESQADVIRGFMDPSLRHHNAAAEAGLAAMPDFREWLEAVYEIFLRWSRDGEDAADYPTLDAVRLQLDDLATPLHRLVSTVTAQAGNLAHKTAEVDALKKEKAVLQGKVDETLTARDEALSVRDALRGEKDRLAQKLSQRDAALQDLQGKVQSLSNALEQHNHEVGAAAEALRGEKDRLAQELSQRDAALQDLQGKVQSLSNALEQRNHEAGAAAEALRGEKDRLAQELSQRDAALQDLQAEVERRRRALRTAERSVVQLREKAARLDAVAKTQADELAQMAQMIVEKEEALKRRKAAAHAADTALAALRHKLARIGAQHEAVLQSDSWKVTAPLRWISRLLRRFARGAGAARQTQRKNGKAT